jgi:hypothetical protein
MIYCELPSTTVPVPRSSNAPIAPAPARSLYEVIRIRGLEIDAGLRRCRDEDRAAVGDAVDRRLDRGRVVGRAIATRPERRDVDPQRRR